MVPCILCSDSDLCDVLELFDVILESVYFISIPTLLHEGDDIITISTRMLKKYWVKHNIVVTDLAIKTGWKCARVTPSI